MKQVPLKNYILFAIVSIASVLLVLYLKNIYESKKEYENSTNMTMGFLKEIHEDDFDNYITENSEFILYMSDSDDKNLIDFEKDLKKKIKKMEYSKDMVYLNLKNISSNFLLKFEKHLSENLKNINLESIPNVVITKEGKIQNYYFINEETNTTDVIIFITNEFYNE